MKKAKRNFFICVFWGVLCLVMVIPSVAANASEVTAFVPDHPTSNDSIQIQYRIDRGYSPVTIDSPSVSITGNVVDINVKVLSNGGFAVGSSATDKVTLGALPAGTYTVRLLVAGVDKLPEVEATQTLWVSAPNSVSEFSFLQVTPNPAMANQPVSLTMTWNNCGSKETPVVEVTGSVVTVLQKYDAICFTPPPPVSITVPLGRFAAGSYTLKFISTSTTSPNIPPDPTITIPFKVESISSGFTGAWYDPAQSGHGVFLEVLPGNTLLAWWFTFTPDGNQAWFGGTGPITGNTASITAALTTGGRFIPNFDPSKIVNTPWGTMDFTFIDCNHIRLNFNSTLGYGVNTMNLTRLTLPAGLSCP